MRRRTREKYEAYLNNFITDNNSLEQVIGEYIYLSHCSDCKPNRSKISKRYYTRTLGTYLRRKDPTRFSIGYVEWRDR